MDAHNVTVSRPCIKPILLAKQSTDAWFLIPGRTFAVV